MVSKTRFSRTWPLYGRLRRGSRRGPFGAAPARVPCFPPPRQPAGSSTQGGPWSGTWRRPVMILGARSSSHLSRSVRATSRAYQALSAAATKARIATMSAATAMTGIVAHHRCGASHAMPTPACRHRATHGPARPAAPPCRHDTASPSWAYVDVRPVRVRPVRAQPPARTGISERSISTGQCANITRIYLPRLTVGEGSYLCSARCRTSCFRWPECAVLAQAPSSPANLRAISPSVALRVAPRP